VRWGLVVVVIVIIVFDTALVVLSTFRRCMED
jgi:hypothetical protein